MLKDVEGHMRADPGSDILIHTYPYKKSGASNCWYD